MANRCPFYEESWPANYCLKNFDRESGGKTRVHQEKYYSLRRNYCETSDHEKCPYFKRK